MSDERESEATAALTLAKALAELDSVRGCCGEARDALSEAIIALANSITMHKAPAGELDRRIEVGHGAVCINPDAIEVEYVG